MHFETFDQASLELGLGSYQCNWGVQMSGLYETQEERDEILFGFLDQGDVARVLHHGRWIRDLIVFSVRVNKLVPIFLLMLNLSRLKSESQMKNIQRSDKFTYGRCFL